VCHAALAGRSIDDVDAFAVIDLHLLAWLVLEAHRALLGRGDIAISRRRKRE